MLCYLSLKKKNYTKVNILILMYLQFIFYNYGHSFYNVSLYYQIINYLNSKSNICFIVVFFLLYELNKKKTNNIIISKIGFFFIWVGLSSTEINQFYLYYINNKNNINNNLLNGIMLIHPYVLYYFYIYFIYYHHHTISNFCLQKLFFWNLYNKNKSIVLKAFLTIYFSIILGCLWAEQELSWGGWWSWDLVELLALNYLIYTLYWLHLKKNKDLINFFLGLMLLLFAILSVRFNIINSIHNFVNIESQNQYYYYVMFIIYSILTIVLYVFLKNFSTLRLGISNIFILIMIILYYMYQYNTITINLTSATYNTQTNTKYIYVFVLIFSLVFLALKKPKKKINPLTIIYLFFFIDLTYISFFIAMALLSLLGSDFNRNSKVKLIHLFLLGLFFFTQQQLYIFNSELIVSDSNSLKLLKVDNIFTTTKYHINNIIEYCYSSKNSQIIFDLYKNNFDFLSGSSKGLFEKNILLSTNTIVELYSYNFQKLTQTGGCGVFILLLFILIIAILTKIKKNINIFL